MPASEGAEGSAGGFLAGVRVLEVGDEKGEFCGKLLAGAGAEVARVEPPGGSPTRRLGPHYKDVEDLERSLHFWHYNTGKLGVRIDLGTDAGRATFARLAERVDVVVSSLPPGSLEEVGLGYDRLSAANPGLVMAAISPFGQSGPYRDWHGSDLVHLALGGVLSQSGFGAETGLGPVAPRMWQAAQMCGNLTFVAILACLVGRLESGRGDFIDASIHRAVNFTTIEDIPYWLFHRQEVIRQAGRYAAPRLVPDPLLTTSDGRYVLAYHYLPRHYTILRTLLRDHGALDDADEAALAAHPDDESPEAQALVEGLVARWVAGVPFDVELWKSAQRARLNWAPIRRPEDNLDDRHWTARGTLVEIRHDEVGETFVYCDQPWLATATPWRTGVRAPLLGEHDDLVLGGWLEGSS